MEFPVVASASDSAKIREEATKIAAEFRTTSDDSSYAIAQSQGSNAYTKYTIANLPASISKDKENLQIGSVNGPFLDGGNF